MGSGSLSYYDALGVERDASSDEIRVAYRKQSLALHPDKNAYGDSLMKYINEAYGALSDKKKRAEYDRDQRRTDRGGNDIGRDSANAVALRRLKQQLENSEKKRAALMKNVFNLADEVDAAQEELSRSKQESKSLLAEKGRQIKKLQHDLRSSGREKKRIQDEVDYLKTESEILERENLGNKLRMEAYESKVEKVSRALREERRKSSDDVDRANERAREEVERVRNAMSERSACYRCNGDAATAEDCAVCEGSGAVQGIWTRCRNCDGTGSFSSVEGEKRSCALCSSKGAREGAFSVTCFKCGGRRNGKGCDVCYRGRIRGFNLQLCPFCRGEGDECENCFGRAYVSCRCGPSCVGHSRFEISKPASSLQMRLASANENVEHDWSAKFLTRNWKSPI